MSSEQSGSGASSFLKARADRAFAVSLLGLGANLFLAALKFTAGFLGRSVAVTADGVNSLSDCVTDVVALVGFRFVARPVDASHDYGHGKVETLTAALVGFSLLAVAALLFRTGIARIVLIVGGQLPPRPTAIALGAALVSIVLKEGLFRYTRRASERLNSPALRAKAWDHRSDVLASAVTFFGIGGAMFFGPKALILDPLAALAVAVAVARVAWSVVRGSLNELLEASLSAETEAAMKALIVAVDGVEGAHNLRTRSIGCQIAVDVHILVRPELTVVAAHDITVDVERRLREAFGEETFITLHVEPLTGLGLAGSPELDDGHDGREGGPSHFDGL